MYVQKLRIITVEELQHEKVFTYNEIAEAELCEDISPIAELRKRELCKVIPLERNFANTLPLERSCRSRTSGRDTLRGELQNLANTFPLCRIAQVDLSEVISPRAELRKRNFPKHISFVVELRNFTNTLPLEQSCGSGTSITHYPLSRVAEAELR